MRDRHQARSNQEQLRDVPVPGAVRTAPVARLFTPTELDLDEHAGAQQLERHIEGHRIGRAELMGLYARQ